MWNTTKKRAARILYQKRETVFLSQRSRRWSQFWDVCGPVLTEEGMQRSGKHDHVPNLSKTSYLEWNCKMSHFQHWIYFLPSIINRRLICDICKWLSHVAQRHTLFGIGVVYKSTYFWKTSNNSRTPLKCWNECSLRVQTKQCFALLLEDATSAFLSHDLLHRFEWNGDWQTTGWLS